MNISKNDKFSVGITAANGVAGTTDINGAEIDMSGYDGCLMIFTFGVITGTAVTSVKAQQDAVTGMATAADLLGTAQTVADTDDEKIFYIDLYKPRERFVRGVVDRGTANAVVTMSYIQYGGSKGASTHGTNVSGELHVSPAEGTA